MNILERTTSVPKIYLCCFCVYFENSIKSWNGWH